MKQAVTVMAVITAAMLLVSGVIVVGSMEQSTQINSQRAQLGELRQRLLDANTRVDEQATSTELLTATLASVRRERDEALNALSEANLAVTDNSQALQDARTAHEEKLINLSARLEEQTLRADALDAELQAVISERNAEGIRLGELESALLAADNEIASAGVRAEAAEAERDGIKAKADALKAEADGLKAELASARDANAKAQERIAAMEQTINSEAEAKQAAGAELERVMKAAEEASAAIVERDSLLARLGALESELADYCTLVELWSAARTGQAEQTELAAAVESFRLSYPNSKLRLPTQDDEEARLAYPEPSLEPSFAPSPAPNAKQVSTPKSTQSASPSSTPSPAPSLILE